ncbi:MAG: GNAT family N-acetyltransferase [Thalassotalea sp.]
MDIQLVRVNYNNEQQGKDLLYLLNQYALDPMGGGKGLSDYAKNNLVNKLKEIASAITLICYVNKVPAGFLNAFVGFSTFNCQPLINIHDLAVLSDFRKLGLSQKLLNGIEEIAREQGCCKVTLEVLSANNAAKHAYKKFGFSGYELNEEFGHALFWEKTL